MLEFCLRKCKLNGKEVDYVPVLFSDEIGHYLIARAINSVSAALMEGGKHVLYMQDDTVPSKVS